MQISKVLKMWINITKEIFEKSNFKDLNLLYQILSMNTSERLTRYNIAVDTEKVKELDNFKKLLSIEENLKEALDIEYTYFCTSSPSDSYKISYQKINNHFNVEEAIRFLNQPVSVVLENNKNDACLVKAIIYYFDDVEVVKEHLKNGWIKFENAGGCRNVKNFIEGFLSAFDDIALRNGKNTSEYFRGVVILDSDKNFPNAPLKPEYNDLQTYLRSKKIAFHPLEKRAMENYMPDEVFTKLKNEINLDKTSHNNWQKMINWIGAFLNLSEPEKDYLNINGGFPQPKDKDGNKKPMKIDIVKLYGFSQDTSDEFKYEQDNKFIVLNEGFSYKGKDFKNEFPLLFTNYGEVNRLSLSKRAGNGGSELFEILTKIHNLL